MYCDSKMDAYVVKYMKNISAYHECDQRHSYNRVGCKVMWLESRLQSVMEFESCSSRHLRTLKIETHRAHVL
jgi:hypothetical protein